MRHTSILIRIAVIAGLAVAASLPAAAGTISYPITVDTHTINGMSGYLDFQFNGGLFSYQAAYVQILNFQPDSGMLLDSPEVSGDVTDVLPDTVIIKNTDPYNDYFQAFQFGSFFSFTLFLGGDALISPDGTSESGSAFALSLFDQDEITPLLTTDLELGFLYTVDVNLDGTTSPASFVPANTAVPEPGSLFLLATGFAGLAAALKCRGK
jgi:hypothetical protein